MVLTKTEGFYNVPSGEEFSKIQYPTLLKKLVGPAGISSIFRPLLNMCGIGFNKIVLGQTMEEIRTYYKLLCGKILWFRTPYGR